MRCEMFLKEAPLSQQAKADYERLVTEKKDYLPGLELGREKGPPRPNELQQLFD